MHIQLHNYIKEYYVYIIYNIITLKILHNKIYIYSLKNIIESYIQQLYIQVFYYTEQKQEGS